MKKSLAMGLFLKLFLDSLWEPWKIFKSCVFLWEKNATNGYLFSEKSLYMGTYFWKKKFTPGHDYGH